MIYNQHDWDQDGMPVLDQDLKDGYNEVEDGIKLSAEDKRFIWLMIGLGLLVLGGIIYACVMYEPPT